MSLCLEASGSVLTAAGQAEISPPSSAPSSSPEAVVNSTTDDGTTITAALVQEAPIPVSKIIATGCTGSVTTITKLPKAPLITVLNTPLVNVKTLCVTPAVSSGGAGGPGQFTVVNSPLANQAGGVVKPQTITLINTPVTVVKTIGPGGVEKSGVDLLPTSSNPTPAPPAVIDGRGHNVFVKNTVEGLSDVPQGHKILTASSFPMSNVITTTMGPSNNGHRPGTSSKVKILSNVLMSSASSHTSSNILLNKQPNVVTLGPQQQQQQQRFVPRPQSQKVGPQQAPNNNGATTKYLNKPLISNNNNNNKVAGTTLNVINKPSQQQGTTRVISYPTHKTHIKTMPLYANNYMQQPMPVKPPGGGIKTIPPKGVPGGHIQRTGGGLRTIPPQRPHHPKLPPTKPNYIGKHAVQAQKVRQPHHKLKGGMKQFPNPCGGVYNKTYHHHHHQNVHHHQQQHHHQMSDKPQLTFNQALTAEILETLGSGNKGGGMSSYNSVTPGKTYEILPPRYESAYYPPPPERLQQQQQQQQHAFVGEQQRVVDDRPTTTKSGLDLIYQAVLLDHNYNATLPPDSPTRPGPLVVPNTPSQINGVCMNSIMYSPGGGVATKRRTLSNSNSMSASTSLSTLSTVASNSMGMQDDDAASDISDGSDRKHDTEGEETDTAPEAEAVNNEDQFGDYVTRCICGFIHDDGYMIECDRCKVWQHVQCVVKNKQVPDEYLCEVCDPRKHIDRHKARLAQQQWLRDRQFGGNADPKLNNKNSKLFKQQQQQQQNQQQQQQQQQQAQQHHPHSDSDTSDGEHHNNNVAVGKGRPTLVNRRKSDGQAKGRQRRDSAKEPVQRRQIKKRERKGAKRKTKAQLKNHSDDENHHHSDLTTNLPQLRQWIENYEEAVTNHYSPELRARIVNLRVNGAHELSPSSNVNYDPAVHKCRVHTQPLTELKYLVSTGHLPPNTPVIELRGKYMLSAQHRNNSGVGNFNTRQHAQRPGPFLFFYRLHRDNTEVCVDTRTYGNSARFIRRSCKPNAELRHTINKGVLHLYIVSIADVDKNVELTIKHESHDLAAIGTTHIACACGKPDECAVNRGTAATATTVPPTKKNGEVQDVAPTQPKKRRGRRSASAAEAQRPPKISAQLTPKQQPAPPPPQVIKPEVKPVEEEVIKQEVALPTEEVVKAKEDPDVKEVVKKEEVTPAKVKVEEEKVKEVETVAVVKQEVDCVDGPAPPVPSQEDVVKVEHEVKEENVKEEEDEDDVTSPISSRRSSHYKEDKDQGMSDDKTTDVTPTAASATGGTRRRNSAAAQLDYDSSSPSPKSSKNKKMSREERKLEAILKAIAQMEKADQRKQEHQAKQAHRRESEPGPGGPKDHHQLHNEDKGDQQQPKMKRRRRKGRLRAASTQGSSTTNRRNRLNSTDSYLTTSGDETMLSPHDHQPPNRPSDIDKNGTDTDKDVGLLLALSNNIKDSNSNSAHSSPETHLSSACLLVQAAVEPMEQGFKFPKTKKGLMNEWLNKGTEPVVHSASAISPSALTPQVGGDYDQFYGTGGSTTPVASATGAVAAVGSTTGVGGKNLAALAHVASFCNSGGGVGGAVVEAPQPRGSAKKRWLRQAISEDQSCESPSNSRPESPPAVVSDAVAPPKKRRLPRESISNDNTPPTTPTNLVPPVNIERPNQEGCVEIVYSGADDDSPTHQTLESDSVLEERVAEMKEEFNNKCSSVILHESIVSSVTTTTLAVAGTTTGCLLDPRLTRSGENHPHRHFLSNDLVGTVEKTLSIFGFDDHRKPEPITPAKRKLSITEYRQRKKLNNNDNADNPDNDGGDKMMDDPTSNGEENNSSESFKPSTRLRSDSTSSFTSVTSSDDEAPQIELPGKAPAFNSEPTELELQREISSMRLKKAFGMPVNPEPRLPALDVEAILSKADIPPVVKATIPPSPNFPIPGSITCDITVATAKTPDVSSVTGVNVIAPAEPIVQKVDNKELSNEPLVEVKSGEKIVEDKQKVDNVVVTDKAGITKPTMFYTPDGEEVEETEKQKGQDENAQEPFEELEPVDYVPPFNNPIYPNDSSFTTYTSAIDDEERYEGRNPSPPPDLTGSEA